MSIINQNWKHGTISLLDILGSKDRYNNSNDYITDIHDLYQYLDEIKLEADKMVNTIIPPSYDLDPDLIMQQIQNFVDNPNVKQDLPSAKPIPPNTKLAIDIETFSDTILIIIYSNTDLGDDALMYYSGIILTRLFRKMFSNKNIPLRGAIGIGDFYMEKKANRSIIYGPPLFEVARLYEAANWMGMITTPSATLTIEQSKSFTISSRKVNLDKADPQLSSIFTKLIDFLNLLDATLMNFIRYDVPLKGSVDNDCYALMWPQEGGEELDNILNRLNIILDAKKFQSTKLSQDLFTKYRNTKLFFDKVHAEKYKIITLAKIIRAEWNQKTS